MKPHIVLINPRLREWNPNVWLPLGLLYIGATLEEEGYNVEIIDLNVERMRNKDLQRRVKNADIVGITGMITEYQKVLQIIDTIKQNNRDRKIILGGPLATTLPRELLQASQADFAVIGEGERTVVNLISAIKHNDDLANIKGIAYRDSTRIIITEPVEPISNLDAIPFPARHLLNMNLYLKNHFESFGLKVKGFGKIKSTNLITSRGCPYSCTFCFKGMWGYRWRARSPENIIDEMDLLYKEYGVNGFFFNDDTFVLNRKRVFEFCELLKKKGLNVVWYCNGRANLMTKELLKTMYEAGCRGIAYGIESGNQQILDSMKKSITLNQVRNVVEWTKEAGIYVTGYFMIGMLGEAKDTIRQTIAFAKELDLDFYGFSIATPLIGTELYDAATERGLIKKETSLFKTWGFYVNMNLTKDCTDNDLVLFKNQAFKEFTLEKFGRWYILNWAFSKGIVKIILSLRSINEVKELAKMTRGIIQSYWHKV